ncbi:TPA: lipopolysaccharide biosynthesis protein [Streptococcus suis]|nr:lipopolysaccharide biosynthesis protein [Streptococcus suis]
MKISDGEKNQNKQYFWNLIGTISSTLISIVLLFIVSRLTSAKMADVFSIAFTLGQQFLVIGLFGVRNYQSTDMCEQHTFSSYFFSRILTTLLMILFGIVYIISVGLNGEKFWIILFMILYRSCDAFSDIFQGYFQQQQRSDLSGKVLFYRSILTILFFPILLILFDNLLIVTFGIFILNFSMIFILDFHYLSRYFKLSLLKDKFDFRNSISILKFCIPLFIGSFLINYIYNDPKIIIDSFITKGQFRAGMQRDFNVLFMPTFVMNLLLLILRPMLTELSIVWYKGEKSVYDQRVRKFFVILSCLNIGILLGGYFLGLPLLSLVFGIDLSPYLLPFIILLMGGGFNVYSVLIDNLLTIHRKQHYLLVVTVLTFLFSKLIMVNLISRYEIAGAAIGFTLTMFVYFLLSIVTYVIIRKFVTEK